MLGVVIQWRNGQNGRTLQVIGFHDHRGRPKTFVPDIALGAQHLGLEVPLRESSGRVSIVIDEPSPMQQSLPWVFGIVCLGISFAKPTAPSAVDPANAALPVAAAAPAAADVEAGDATETRPTRAPVPRPRSLPSSGPQSAPQSAPQLAPQSAP